jgi:hypothetical protein
MTNPNRNRKPKGRRSKVKDQPMVPLLKEIRDSLLVSQTSGLPDVPDITIPPLKRNKIHTFNQSFVAAVTSSTSVETDGAFTFKLSDLVNASSFTTLFDRWRIIFVRSEWQPLSASQSGSPVYTVIDYDDSTTLSANSLLAYDTCKTSPAGAYFERSIRPVINVAASVGGTFSGAASQNSWCDVGSPSVSHYGLKFAIPSSTVANIWSVRFTYTIQFINIR